MYVKSIDPRILYEEFKRRKIDPNTIEKNEHGGVLSLWMVGAGILANYQLKGQEITYGLYFDIDIEELRKIFHYTITKLTLGAIHDDPLQ